MTRDAYIGVIGIALAVAFGLLSIYFWFRPRALQPRLYWRTISSVPLLRHPGALLDGIKISIGGKDIPRATIWTGTLWNAGGAALRPTDVAPGGLTYRFPGAEVLGTAVLAASRQECGLAVPYEPGGVEVTFRFLNPRDGATVAILHTGDSETSPELTGAVIDGEVLSANPDDFPKLPSAVLMVGVFVFSVASHSLLIDAPSPPAPPLIEKTLSIIRWIYPVMISIGVVAVAVMFFKISTFKRAPSFPVTREGAE